MFADPPLVEKPMAMSPGCACAIIWRAKMASPPMSLAMAVMFAGSAASEMARTGAKPEGGGGGGTPGRQAGGGRQAVRDQVVGMGGGAAVSEGDDLAAAFKPHRDCLRRFREGFTFGGRGSLPHRIDFHHLLKNRPLNVL